MCECSDMADVFTDRTALARDLRERAGLSAGYASDLAHGRRGPSLQKALVIRDKLGIAVEVWPLKPTPNASSRARTARPEHEQAA